VNQRDIPPEVKPRRIRLGKYGFNLPASRLLRILLGVGLVIGGCLGFLPILGFWMIPLGIIVLSVDFHPIRRLRRRFDVHWGRRTRPNGRKAS
jgi:purine-cytosine permease-like protein